MIRIRTLSLALALTAGLATACGNGAPTTSGGGGGGGASSLPGTGGQNLGTATVTVNETDDLKFTPSTVTAKVGDIIAFVNKGSSVHNVIFDADPNKTGLSTPADMQGGDTYQVKFSQAGSYAFKCSYHAANGMTGTITVQ
jgi:plastocyanin